MFEDALVVDVSVAAAFNHFRGSMRMHGDSHSSDITYKTCVAPAPASHSLMAHSLLLSHPPTYLGSPPHMQLLLDRLLIRSASECSSSSASEYVSPRPSKCGILVDGFPRTSRQVCLYCWGMQGGPGIFKEVKHLMDW